MSVGRNESCPCGSGKKYKKCCGIVTSIAEARNNREQKARKEINLLLERVNNFVSSNTTADAMRSTRQRFAEQIGLEQEEVVQSEWALHFYNWFVFDAKENGMSFIERYLQQHGRKLDQELATALKEAQLSVYEVAEVAADELTMINLASGHTHKVLPNAGLKLQSGQLLLTRLVSLGQRDMALPGSIILQPRLKATISASLQKAADKEAGAIALYQTVVQSGKEATPQATADQLVRRIYSDVKQAAMLKRLQNEAVFELKKRDNQRDVWIFSRRKEAQLFPELDNTLIELHEVGGEVLLEEGTLTVEAPQSRLEEIAQALQLHERKVEDKAIDRLSSTGGRLIAGTLFITSEPTLPSKVLQWAVQTYFSRKWLLTPHPALKQLPPLLAAASEDAETQAALNRLVESVEEEGKRGQGIGRFMRVDILRPSLALPNSLYHINNLLQRPLIEGLTESAYTASPERLNEIGTFVAEMTSGKSEATVKKYDDVMNHFRSFVRERFAPAFTWADLRKEDIAYFLVQDLPRRTDSLTKTLATNALSVLTAFTKWLDKREKAELAARFAPLFAEIKDDLPESYRLRGLLQKEAYQHLGDQRLLPQQVQENHVITLEQQKTGWTVKESNGETFLLELPQDVIEALSEDWLLAGVMGKAADGKWYVYGTPSLYPPVISELLGIRHTVLV